VPQIVPEGQKATASMLVKVPLPSPVSPAAGTAPTGPKVQTQDKQPSAPQSVTRSFVLPV
jgi:hypothetical protein